MSGNLDTILLGSALFLMVVMIIRVLLARFRGSAGPHAAGSPTAEPRPAEPHSAGPQAAGQTGDGAQARVDEMSKGATLNVPPPPPAAPSAANAGPAAKVAPVTGDQRMAPPAAGTIPPGAAVDPVLSASLRDMGAAPTALFGNRSKVVVKSTKSGRHVAVSPSGQHEVVQVPASLDDIIKTMNNPLAPALQRVSAIRQLATQHADVAVDPLIRILYDAVPEVAAAAAEGLGLIGDPRAIEAMLEVTRTLDEKLVLATGGEASPAMSAAGTAATGTRDLLPAPFDFREVGMLRPDLLPARYLGPDGTLVSRKALVTQGLDDSELNIRQMAAKAAIGSKDPDLLLPLVRTLEKKFEAESVRYLAAQALGEMGDERAVGPLLDALHDESVAVRYASAESLGHYQGSQTVLALLDALGDSNEFVRSAVAHSLGQTGDDAAVEALLATLEDGSEVVRYTASEALGRLPDKTVVDKLARRMETASSSLKQNLIEALGSRLDDAHAFQLVRDSLRDPDPDVRFRASIALMNQDSLVALDDLIAAAKELDAELISYARDEGGELEGFDPERPVGPRKAATHGRAERGAAPHAGGANGNGNGTGQGQVKAPISAATGKVPPKNGGGMTFAHGAPSRSDETTDFAANLKVAAATQPLDPAYVTKQEQDLRHESYFVRSCAAVNLGETRSTVAVGLLIAVLGDEHELVRASAVSSLGKIGDNDTVGSLMPLADDLSDEVRYSLVKALGAIGGADARHALERMSQHDPAKEVRRAARQALESMG